MIPSPPLLGLPPARFPRWRPGQAEAIEAIHTSPTKFTGVVAPTGFGKSAMVMGYALHSGLRVAILTSTKALQDQYCVAPGTRVVTADMRWVPIETLKPGDKLLGFDEHRTPNRRNWRGSVVTSTRLLKKPCYRIALADGTVIVCSADHKWLSGQSHRWLTTEQLRCDGVQSSLLRALPMWDTATDNDAGYLAAAFDGEGHLHQRDLGNGADVNLSFAQRHNPMLDRVVRILTAKGYRYNQSEDSTGCTRTQISGRSNVLRFLGEIRPDRLLPKLNLDCLGMVGPLKPVKLVAKEFIGEQEVVALSTTSRTFVAEGFASHNCNDFSDLVLDLRGQSNYQCEIALVSVAEGPCHTGSRCELKQDGCIYFDTKRTAARERIVLTNYQMWLHSMREKVGIGDFDAVICDEAHNIHAELSKFLSTRITGHETKHHLGGTHPDKEWSKWAENSYYHLAGRMGDIRKSRVLSEAERLKELAGIKTLRRKLSLLAKAVPDGWIMQEGGYRGEYQWECIHPGRYASKYLFQRAEKFVLTSASIRPKTFASMYIAASKVTFKEYPSSFPVSRRPVYVYPAIKYSYESTAAELRFLIAIIDQFIDQRLDRKGIIHSVSYERAELIRANSRHRKLMIGNHTGDELPRVVEKFRTAKAPCILVSPSVTEGHSFPGSECEYIIVPKVPFGNTSTDVYKARAAHDRTYGILETCVLLRQMLGRGMRSALDQCEGLILDSQFDWLHRQHRKLFPGDFNESIQHVRYLPPPPQSLVGGK